jgi:O-acetylhomoserine/O-acetylserine sulfhydrylase-like pyridoxal-dependent enzyme
VPDFEAIAQCRSARYSFDVANTFVQARYFSPLEHVRVWWWKALTKWFGGHGTTLGP